MTPDRIAAIKALLDDASTPDGEVTDMGRDQLIRWAVSALANPSCLGRFRFEADAQLFTNTTSAINDLLTEVQRLQDANKTLVSGLKGFLKKISDHLEDAEDGLSVAEQRANPDHHNIPRGNTQEVSQR